MRGLASHRKDGAAVAIGSRFHLSGAHAAKRTFSRRAVASFQSLLGGIVGARTVAGQPIHDLQCGFKLVSRHAAQLTFPALHVERWAFDAELLVLAARRNIPVAEVPVSWHEVEGSRVGLISGSLQMAREVLVMCLSYGLGIWTDDLPQAFLDAALERGTHPSGAAASRFDRARDLQRHAADAVGLLARVHRANAPASPEHVTIRRRDPLVGLGEPEAGVRGAPALPPPAHHDPAAFAVAAQAALAAEAAKRAFVPSGGSGGARHSGAYSAPHDLAARKSTVEEPSRSGPGGPPPRSGSHATRATAARPPRRVSGMA